MTTRRTLSWVIPGSPQEILRRCQAPDVARRRAESDPTLEGRVTELAADTDDGAVLVMEVTAVVPPSWIPPRLSASMPGRPTIVRRETWHLTDDGCAHADVQVRLESIPATRMTAAARLCPEGDARSTLTYELELDVSLPVVGSTIERAALERVCRAYDKDAHVIATS